ncbi:MAG TPA: hypothetical protein PLG90_04575 [Ignavibacteria bacterium]|nr:hypothetical protein [Ignavibacteria bacterium]
MKFIFASFFFFVIWVISESFLIQKFNSVSSLYNFGFYNSAVFFLGIGLFYAYDDLKNDKLEYNFSFKDYFLYGLKMVVLFLILGVFFTYFYYEYFNKKIINEVILSIKTNPLFKSKQLNSLFNSEIIRFELNTYFLSFKFVIYNLISGIVFILIFSKVFNQNHYKNS